MAAFTAYDQIPKRFIDGTIDWLNDDVKLALVNDNYVPNSEHLAFIVNVADHEVDDLSYDAQTLTNKGISAGFMTADSVSYPQLTAEFRYVVMYAEGVDMGPDQLTNPLIGYWDLGEEIEVNATDYTPQFDAQGVFALENTPCS